jgi:TolB-like protein
MSFFEEIKRRNVIRVAIAYGVGAWFILQLSDVVLENINAPEWVMQFVMLALLVGLPVVIILAWAFEMTPEGIKKEKDVDRSQSITTVTGRKLDRIIIGVLTVVVAYLLIDKLVLEEDTAVLEAPTQVSTAEVATETETSPSVAVLPFVNMSGDQENEYFSDGLTETLLHMLAQIPGLQVAARTSSFAFKDQNLSIGEIAATLGVKHILEGSVQKSGERVRVTAQLIRADDGFHVWSQNYTRPLEDIFAIQDEIATDVATALDASLLGNTAPDLKGISTSNLTAYDNYLKGLEQQAIFSYGSLNKAEDFLKQSLALDPDFTDARLALIRNYIQKNSTGAIDKEELGISVEPLIVQVREKDPDNRLARAFELLMELVNFNPGNNSEEVRAVVTELRNTLPLMASETLIRRMVSLFLDEYFDQQRDAIEVVEAGLLLDPLSADLHATLGNIYQNHDRLEAALESFRRAQTLAPENPNHYGALGSLERDNNNLASALDWQRQAIELDPQDHELVAALATTLYQLELPEEGDPWFNRVKALAPGSDIARSVELLRAVSKHEEAFALKLAESMIIDQVDPRRGSFYYALDIYSYLMMQAGKDKEAWEFLVSVRPEIANYDMLPTDTQGLTMQFVSIMLMTGFESFDTRKQAWMKLAANFDAQGFPWRDPEDGNYIIDLVMLGEADDAIEHMLSVRLNKPMATNIDRHKRVRSRFWQPVSTDPRVAARLTELDSEFEQLQQEIGELMLEPEWNQ